MPVPGDGTEPDGGVDVAATFAELSGRLRRALRAGVRRNWPYDQLSTAQLDLLRLVTETPGMSINDAAGHLGVQANTVSGLVRDMIAEGLIIRGTDPGDRRIGRLTASPLAARRLRRWRGSRDQLLAEALTRLDERDRHALTAASPALRRLVEALEDGPPDHEAETASPPPVAGAT